jgi:Zn-dependent peptidase ImmA (M78 family)
MNHNGSMPVRLDIVPDVLVWAAERSGVAPDVLAARFPLTAWIQGERRPTVRQLEDYARATRTPFGMLLLPSPPDERLPVPDFRTMPGADVTRPTADLLDTIYLCQRRQEWYREFALANDDVPLDFVGSLEPGSDVTQAASRMREVLGFDTEQRAEYGSWSDALRGLAERAEALGVLVMTSGIVGSNTRRTLNPEEFRGLALVDDVAPLVFVNGADTKAAQIFTLAHELAHVWAGKSGVSNPRLQRRDDTDAIERWCNAVAAEFLVPLEHLSSTFEDTSDMARQLERLARRYRVSTLVIVRRVFDLGALPSDEFQRAYKRELDRVMAELERRGPRGGSFYKTLPSRTGKRFARAIIASTLEGQTLYRDAFRLLGIRNASAFDELRNRLRLA